MTEMLFKTAHLLAYTYLVVFYYLAINRRINFPTAMNLFILGQIPVFIGTVLLADVFGREFDPTRMLSMLVGTVLLVAGCATANRVLSFEPRREFKSYMDRPAVFDLHGGVYLWLVILMGIIACIVGQVFVSAIGYNMPLALLDTYLATGSRAETAIVYGTLRTWTLRHPERYVAPGYTSQFIIVLLPLVFYLLYSRVLVLKRIPDKILAFVFLLACIYFGTVRGIRGHVVLFTITFLTLTSQKYGPLGKLIGSSHSRLPLLTAILAGGSYVMFTLLGRLGATTASSVWDVFSTMIAELFNRVVFVTAYAQLRAMEYLHTLPLGWGRGWVQSLSGVLPGSAPNLSGEIYRMVFGGGYGSGPVDIWSSIWLEFGWLGTILVPFVLGFLLQWFSILSLRGGKTVSRSVILFVSSFSLMQVHEPIALFNSGFITLMIYYWLARIVKHFEQRANIERHVPRTEPYPGPREMVV